MRTLSRVSAVALTLALLGGGVAYAGDDGAAGEGGDGGEKTEVVDEDRPTVPDELKAAFESYRSALREWRHCIIDMVTGDATVESCGGAPDPADHGLSAEDLLNYDLDERIAERVDAKLTRIEIKTTCIEAHAAEGRRAVYECVWEAIGHKIGDRAEQRLDCKRGEFRGSEVTTPVAEDDKDAANRTCNSDGRILPRPGDEGGDDGRGDRTGRDANKDA